MQGEMEGSPCVNQGCPCMHTKARIGLVTHLGPFKVKERVVDVVRHINTVGRVQWAPPTRRWVHCIVSASQHDRYENVFATFCVGREISQMGANNRVKKNQAQAPCCTLPPHHLPRIHARTCDRLTRAYSLSLTYIRSYTHSHTHTLIHIHIDHTHILVHTYTHT